MELLVSILINVNFFHASIDFGLLLITFANSLDPDQDQQNVGPDLDPNSWTLMVFLKVFFEKVNFEISEQTTDFKRMKNYPACKELRATSQETFKFLHTRSGLPLFLHKKILSHIPCTNLLER